MLKVYNNLKFKFEEHKQLFFGGFYTNIFLQDSKELIFKYEELLLIRLSTR